MYQVYGSTFIIHNIISNFYVFLFLNVQCTNMSIGSNEVILISEYTLGVVKSIFKRFWKKKFFALGISKKK